ncbi:hypothetical protein M438DRAFT_283436 [Aureobasidium pullulans EXF-150]|uniref:DUF7726 domain-containing protein n=1 Tax=Aureobasidium pullulans EXF-150 TaxID=1043002 RepID=A0A074X262_AURPU|nr:uncharacterized protein M438DRAFT_283436 [Aureobasidium pullulans EXF-150]KEQ79565.1 hypothetical protein M438DRAFT_283436 [Aureobasidium pullulans EXF-150]
MDRYLVHSTAPTGNTAEHVAHAQPAQLAGSKRKSTDAPPTIHLDDFDVSEGQVMDSCTVVRGKIKRFLDSGEMRIGQFCDAIGVSQNAYRRFMAEKGQYGGMGCDTYQGAWEFFRKREMAGLKIPTKKQKTAAAAKAGASAASAKSSTMIGKKDAVTDISSVHLEGEDDDSVEVYDSCDEIRKKINAYLRKPGVTAAQLCRDLRDQYHSEKKPSQIQSGQLTKFRSYKGADTGNTSCVFYAAYVFFEKMRIAEGKPMSKHRQEMESIWGDSGGFNITRGHHRGYLCLGDEKPVQDQFGRIRMV